MSRWRYFTIYREADYYDGDLQVIVDGASQENLHRRSRYALRLDLNAHTIKVKFPGFLGASVTLRAPAGDDDVYYDLGVNQNQEIMARGWGETNPAYHAMIWPAPASSLQELGIVPSKLREELKILLNSANGSLYRKMRDSGIKNVIVKADGGAIFFKTMSGDNTLERIYYNEIGDDSVTSDIQHVWIRREGEAKLIRQFICDFVESSKYPGLHMYNDMLNMDPSASVSAQQNYGTSGPSTATRKVVLTRTPENNDVAIEMYHGQTRLGTLQKAGQYTLQLTPQYTKYGDLYMDELMFIETKTYTSKKFVIMEGNEDINLEVEFSNSGFISLRSKVKRWHVTPDGQSILVSWVNPEKLISQLKRLLYPVSGYLYKYIYEKDAYLLPKVSLGDIVIENNGEFAAYISAKDFAWGFEGDGTGISVNSEDDAEEIMGIIRQFVNSDACPGLRTVTPTSNLICKDPASAVKPSVFTSAGEDAETTKRVKDAIKENFSISGGKLFDMLLSGKADYIEVSVLRQMVELSAHYTGTDELDYDDVLTVNFEQEFIKALEDNAICSKLRGDDLYTSLDEVWERNYLMDSIRNMINDESTFGVYMKDDRIYLDPEAQNRPEYPDINDSMTTSLLWIMVNNEFGEETDFEERIKDHPATCYVSADEDRLRITVMEESDGGQTRTVEFPYAECTYDKFPEGVGWETMRMELWQNRYERLVREEDRAELEDYLMYFIGCIPHVIVEGNSFRSRRPGEELIEVEQTLTAKVMSQNAAKLFDLNGKFVDILRHSDIDYCQIAVYNDYIKFLFIDRETDDIAESIKKDYTELADADFLSGEGCFSRLTCQYETDQLAECIGKAVCKLPYFKCGHYSMGEPDYSRIYLNTDMVPVIDEAFMPASDETDVHEEHVETEIAAEPEPEKVIDNGPAFSVHASPTTWAIVAAMNLQFAEGGGLNQYMKASGFSGADMTTSAYEIGIGFWKNGECSTRLFMQYAQFNKGIPGEFNSLGDEDQKTLQTAIRTAVPYFDI